MGEPAPGVSTDAPSVPVVLSRTARGWSVVSALGSADAADLVEGLCLVDLVAEEFGPLVEPDRSARRSARGAAGIPAEDTADARVAALERTVAQLEHALAARVSTERAIGVLAERHGTSPRAAFESMRRDARSQGRPVAELARVVLDGLQRDPEPDRDVLTGAPGAPATTPQPRSGPPAVVAADGSS